MTGSTSMAAGALEKALFQVKVAVACPCAGMDGTMVCEAATTSPCVSCTRTMTRTSDNLVMLELPRTASMRGASVVPLSVVFVTTGFMRGSLAIWNHLGEEDAMVRNARTPV